MSSIEIIQPIFNVDNLIISGRFTLDPLVFCVWSRIGRTEMAIVLFGVNSFKYFEKERFLFK